MAGTVHARRGALGGWGWFFLLVLVGGGYWAVAFGPAYVQNLQAKQAMHEVANIAVHERSVERLTYELLKRLGRIGVYTEVDEDGEPVEVAPIQVEEDDVEMERDDEKKILRMRITYVRKVKLPIFNRTATVRFSPEIEADISPVVW